MQNYKLEKEAKKHKWLGEVHEGGKGLHWTVVPLKKKKGSGFCKSNEKEYNQLHINVRGGLNKFDKF